MRQQVNGILLQSWKMQTQLNENQPNGNFLVEPTDERQRESAGNDRAEKTDQNSVAKGLHNWIYDDQRPRRENFSSFLMEVEQKMGRMISSRFPEIAKLEKRSLSRNERWSRLEA